MHAATLNVSGLAPSPTMMSCTVHSPMDSLAQPSCTLVYIVCNPAPRGSPFELSLSLCSSQLSPILSLPSQSFCVVVCPWFHLGLPQGSYYFSNENFTFLCIIKFRKWLSHNRVKGSLFWMTTNSLKKIANSASQDFVHSMMVFFELKECMVSH